MKQEKQTTLDGSEFEPINREIKHNLKCFICMEPIEEKPFNPFKAHDPEYTSVYVNADFCHSSYWQHGKNEPRYGDLEPDKKHGYLYVHREEAKANGEDYGNDLGEGYEFCDGCGVTFSEEDMSMDVYEKAGECYCGECATDFVNSNLHDFINTKLPDFNKPLPCIHISGKLKLSKKLRRAPEDDSIMRDIDDAIRENAIKAIVKRKNGWILLDNDIFEYILNAKEEVVFD
jgi:hypothetical protein